MSATPAARDDAADTEPLAGRLLAFWFGARGSPEWGAPRAIWFEKNAAFDAELRRRFADAHDQAARGLLDGLAATPEGALALVILLDQVPRNIFRGQARAFATDASARAIAEAALAAGHERALTPLERMFLYLPFEHSERLADQDRSVALFATLKQFSETADTGATIARHRDIIAHFGRFPHRNAILGRVSTPEEEAFLLEPNSSF